MILSTFFNQIHILINGRQDEDSRKESHQGKVDWEGHSCQCPDFNQAFQVKGRKVETADREDN